MAAIIYDPVQFYKKMNRMDSVGNKSAIAVRQAREIISSLADKNHLDHELRIKLSQDGEARIKNCIKFQLVDGHRMVAVKEKDWFIFLFLGTHDEADNWIKNNMNMRPDPARGKVVPPSDQSQNSQEEPEQDEQPEGQEPPSIHDLDVPLHEVLDQKTLREIFPGICAPPR